MSGDALKKVQVGQRMRIPAATFNTFIDAAKDYLQRQQSVGGSTQGAGLPVGVVLVRNDTGADRDLFEIVALDGPLYGPNDNEPEFKFRFALKGVVPESDHFGRFAILLEPVKDGAIGRGLVQGLTPVLVRVPDLGGNESGDYADINAAEGDLCAHLVAGPRGAAHILWLADQDPELEEGEPDVRWALVRVSSATPSDAAVAIHTLKVTSVWASYGVPFDPDVHPFIAFVTGHFAFSDKSWVDESTVFYIKATNLPDDARVGFKNIQVGDFIGYAMLDGFEAVPGAPQGTVYHGQVIAFPGPEGALLLTSTKIIGGPGIKVDPNPDPAKDEPKVSTDLADEAGLEYNQPGDDGKLKVKPNGDDAIKVTAAGVGVKITDNGGLYFSAQGNLTVDPDDSKAIAVSADGVAVKVAADVSPGLAFGAAGGLKALPDTTRGIDVDALGLFVIVNPNLGISVDANGVKALGDATRAVSVDANGIGVDVDTNYGLSVVGNKVQAKIGGGLEFDGGTIKIPEHADGGLNHREDGRLGVKADATRGLDTDTNGVYILLKSGGGLEFDGGDVAHLLGAATQGQLLTDVTGENLGAQDAANLFEANGHLVATSGKKAKHTGHGVAARTLKVNIAGEWLCLVLDANDHVVNFGWNL